MSQHDTRTDTDESQDENTSRPHGGPMSELASEWEQADE
jgi:hypothetical protein